MSTADEVTVEAARDRISATGVAAAPPAVVFDILRRPANHQAINGDDTVKGTLEGPELLELGSRFGMRMRLGVPYRIHSKVTAYEPDHVIAWRHVGGHEWRWTLEPTADGQSTTITAQSASRWTSAATSEPNSRPSIPWWWWPTTMALACRSFATSTISRAGSPGAHT